MSSSSRRESGGCLCGGIRFIAGGEPLWVVHCHCRSCRRHTGSAVATFAGYPRKQVQFIAEHRSIYSSSPGVFRSFCNRCGTPLAYEAQDAAGEIHLYVGTFDAPERFPPQRHVFYDEKVPWLLLHDPPT